VASGDGESGKVAGLLRDLTAAVTAEGESLRNLLVANARLAAASARDVMAAKGVTVLLDLVGRPGRFDMVGLTAAGDALVVVEADASLSARFSTQRLLSTGERVPQGSAAYFIDVFRWDAEVVRLLRARPPLLAGLIDGSIAIRYQWVEVDEAGKVSLTDLRMDPAFVRTAVAERFA
jgi:hypothetical protein